MKTLLSIFSIAVAYLMVSCNAPVPTNPIEMAKGDRLSKVNHNKATGTVQVMRLDNNGNQSNDKIMIADFNAHIDEDDQTAWGTFLFTVLNSDSTPHRQITMDIDSVYVDANANKAWFKGFVIADTKGCTGNGSGGHSEGCEGGGCSGDVNGEHSEGCSGFDSGHDSGCTGDDSQEHEGGCSGSGGNGGGPGVSGQNCRIGQVLAVKVHDVGTPGTNGDGITWKWFDPNNPIVASLVIANGNVGSWPHLCKKTILSGNLVVHD